MYQHSLQQAEARISNAGKQIRLHAVTKLCKSSANGSVSCPVGKKPDGSCISSSGLNQCLSSLATGFTLLGRVSSWTPEHPSGNPMQSRLISSHRKGYKRQSWRSEYLKGSAVPISKSKVDQLIDYLDSLLLQEPSAIMRLLLQRDALLA